MDQARAAPVAGVVACLLTVGAVAAPYLLLDGDEPVAIGSYYGLGLVSPLGIGLLALLGVIIFAAGREGRTDPSLVAGVMLAVGVFSLLGAVEWALAFRPDLVGSTSALEFMEDHRWTVVAGTGSITLAAAWYAAALDLLPLPARPGG